MDKKASPQKESEWEKDLSFRFDTWLKLYPGTPTIGEIEEWFLESLRISITTAVAKRELEIAEDAEKKTCPNKGKENCICSQCYMPTTPEKKCCDNCYLIIHSYPSIDSCENINCQCHQEKLQTYFYKVTCGRCEKSIKLKHSCGRV